MALTSIGDLSRMLTLRDANVTTKSELATRSKELTTGIADDIPKALNGDTTRIHHINARLETLSAYQQAASTLGGRAEHMQMVLQGVQTAVQVTGPDLLKAITTPTADIITTATQGARSQLSSMIAQINTQIGGQYLFSGTETTVAPLPDAQTLMAQVQATIGGLTDPDDIIAAVNTFFDASAGAGGFIDTTYQGGTNMQTGAIAADQTVTLGVTAASPAVRDALKGMALLTLAADAATSSETQIQLVSAAAYTLMYADNNLSLLRGNIGNSETAIEAAQARSAAETSALQLSQNTMIGIDPYEAASALAEAEARMEAIYSLTARLSRLSLAAYL